MPKLGRTTGREVGLSTGFLDEGVLVSARQPLLLPHCSLPGPLQVGEAAMRVCKTSSEPRGRPQVGPELQGGPDHQDQHRSESRPHVALWVTTNPKPPIPTAFPAQSIHVGRIDPAACPHARLTPGHQTSASMAFQVEHSPYKWDCRMAGETTTRACPGARASGGKGMAHSAGTQGRLSRSSDLRGGGA